MLVHVAEARLEKRAAYLWKFYVACDKYIQALKGSLRRCYGAYIAIVAPRLSSGVLQPSVQVTGMRDWPLVREIDTFSTSPGRSRAMWSGHASCVMTTDPGIHDVEGTGSPVVQLDEAWVNGHTETLKARQFRTDRRCRASIQCQADFDGNIFRHKLFGSPHECKLHSRVVGPPNCQQAELNVV